MRGKSRPKSGLNLTNVLASAAFGVMAAASFSHLTGEPEETPDNFTIEIFKDDDKKPSEVCVVKDFQMACGPNLAAAEYNLVHHPQPVAAAGKRFSEAAQAKIIAPVARHTETKSVRDFSSSQHYRAPAGGKIYTGLRYDVPEAYQNALKSVTHGDPISYDVMVKVLGSESGFKDQKSPTGAFSVGQFTFSTFLETVYRHRNLLSKSKRAIVEKNIEQYNSAPKGAPSVLRYRIAEKGSEDKVRALSKDPHVTSVLAREHMRTATKAGVSMFRDLLEERLNFLRGESYTGPRDHAYQHRVEQLEAHLARPITTTDVKIFYLCGSRGGAKLLLAVADPRAHQNRSGDYTTEQVAKSNPMVFKDENGRHRSVLALHDYMVQRVGNKPLPASLDRPSDIQTAMVQTASLSR